MYNLSNAFFQRNIIDLTIMLNEIFICIRKDNNQVFFSYIE